MKKLHSNKKTNIFKKIFVLLSRFAGYEIVDQNKFYSPSLNKNLNENLSIQGKKSIILPLGEVKINRKANSILIIFRSCSEVHLWSQNKKRIFEAPKYEYTLRSLNSLIKSIKEAIIQMPKINFQIVVIDNNSSKDVIDKMHLMLKSLDIKFTFFNVNNDDFDGIIEKTDTETASNLSSLYKTYLIARERADDLVFFVEDDYLHHLNTITEMILTYEKFSSLLNKEIFLCPSDYPYLYVKPKNTNILLGNSLHWRIIEESLSTFLTSKAMIEKFWKNFENTCLKRNDPFEMYYHEMYKSEYCLSPIPSLSIHCANINSAYGLPPGINWKKIWDENCIKI